jgi:hypothetical protein
MDTVVIKVYKDRNGVYPAGRNQPIAKASQLLGTGWVSMIDPHDMQINSSAPSMNLMKISVPGEGEVYTDLTEQGWFNLLNGTNGGGGGGGGTDTGVIEWTIGVGGDIPAGTSVVMPDLFNIEILDIELDNANVNDILQPGFFNPNFGINLGKLDFAVKGMVLTDNTPADLSVLKIIYKQL